MGIKTNISRAILATTINISYDGTFFNVRITNQRCELLFSQGNLRTESAVNFAIACFFLQDAKNDVTFSINTK